MNAKEKTGGMGLAWRRIPPHALLFLVFWALVHSLLALLEVPQVLTGAQVDSDGYMRLVRVGLLLDHGDWFDGSIHRSNWPIGEDIHWTRPLDVLILALALPFRLILTWDGALAVAGALISPLIHLVICVVAVWVIKPLVPGRERFLAMPAVLMQLGLLLYASVGRADHHALIFLLFILAVGAWIRTLLSPREMRWPFWAGIFSGLGIWVSPESLLPLAMIFLSGGVAWLMEGTVRATQNLRLCAGLVLALLVAIVLEHPPSEWLSSEFDRISLPHLTMAMIASAFWGIAGAVSSRGARTLTAAVGAPLSVILLRLIHPDFFRGPWVDVNSEVIEVWLTYVQELQPLFPTAWADLGKMVFFLGLPLAMLVVTAFRVRGASIMGGGRAVWVFLFLSLLVYVPLSLAQFRFSGYAGIIAALVAVSLIAQVRRLIEQRRDEGGSRPALASLQKAGATAGILVGSLFVGAGLAWAFGDNPEAGSSSVTQTEPDESCSIAQIAPYLSDPEGLGSRPRTIASFIDFGPELLYRTPHRILSGPYHRNAEGILSAYRLLASTDPVEIQTILREREIDLILLCPDTDRFYFGRSEPGSLYDALVETDPDGLAERLGIRAITIAPPGVGFRLFQVEPRLNANPWAR